MISWETVHKPLSGKFGQNIFLDWDEAGGICCLLNCFNKRYSLRFMQLIGIVPSDAAVLQRLGEMYDQEDDKSQAFQYYYDVSSLMIQVSKCSL